MKANVRTMVNLLLSFALYTGGHAAPFIVNAFPVATIAEGGSYVIDLSSYYNDTDGVIVEYKLIEPAGFSFKQSGSVFKIIPPPNDFGDFWIPIFAINDSGDSCGSVLNLIVKSFNDPPRFVVYPSDTSLYVNQQLVLDVHSLVNDIDNQFDDLFLSWDNVRGVTIRGTDDSLYIKAPQSIDTATITLRVRDPGLATSTVSFKFFANRPVAYNTPFRIQGDYTYRPGSLYYPEHVFKAVVDNFGDNSIGIYGILDGYLFYDRYGTTGQKTYPTLIHSSLKPKNSSEVEVHRLRNNSFFVFYTGGDSLECILLDTAFVQISKLSMSKNSMSGMIFREAPGMLLVGGRTVVSGSRYRMTIEIYDGALMKLRTDTLPDEFVRGSVAELLTDDAGYTVFFGDQSASVITSEFNAYRFTNEGTLAYRRTMLLPKIDRNPERPINAEIKPKFARFPDGRFAAVWSFQDALQTGTNQYSIGSKPYCYGISFDRNLQQPTNPVVIYSYETEFIRTLAVSSLQVTNSTILVTWRDYAGNGDPVYYRHLLYNLNFTPIDKVYSDSIHITDYRWINQSMLFKIENRDDGLLWGKVVYPAYAGATGTRISGSTRPFVTGPEGTLRAAGHYFDLKGRKVPPPTNAYQTIPGHTAAGFYLNRVPGATMKKMVVE